MVDYGERVTRLNDENSLKAMKAMTKTLNNSLTLNPHTTGVLAVSEIPLKQGNLVTKPVMGSKN